MASIVDLLDVDFRQCLDDFTEVQGVYEKFYLRFDFQDAKGVWKTAGKSHVVLFKNHAIVACRRGHGLFLVSLWEVKWRNKNPHMCLIAKSYVDQEFRLDHDGFTFCNGKRCKFGCRRPPSSKNTSQKEKLKFNRSKEKAEFESIMQECYA